mgnify:CR=1 FL=1
MVNFTNLEGRLNSKMLHKARLFEYLSSNIGFGIHYDKIYKKEYLPSRIRYSQFFFYTGLATGCYFFLSKSRGGSNFSPQENQLSPTSDLSERKYYTSERSVVNPVMRIFNTQAAASHVSKQKFVF